VAAEGNIFKKLRRFILLMFENEKNSVQRIKQFGILANT
jgi:hypothetical protein